MQQRYMDDCICTDCDNFLEKAALTYPPDLAIKKTNAQDNKASFLDLNIELDKGDIKLSVYNKTDDFPFRVVKYCSEDSNVSGKIGYDLFYCQLIRFGRICNSAKAFETRVIDCFFELIKNGFDRDKLIETFFRFSKKNSTTITRVGFYHKADIYGFAARNFLR
jgi:hypothetical protein